MIFKVLPIITLILITAFGAVFFNFYGDRYFKDQTFSGVIQISEIPQSLKGVEMTTYKSSYGYEITYPKRWVIKDITNVFYKRTLSTYMVMPEKINDPIVQDQVLTISVESKTLKSFRDEVSEGKDIRIKSLNDLIPVAINGFNGFQKPFENQESFYYLESNKKLYSLHFHFDPSLRISKEEALWVLSTFKIVDAK
ncbi:MAG: hypothetical protein AAB903_01630 [Patescibacteria group bacterium]